MFGPFRMGDSLRVYRLQRQGTCLDLERSLTQPPMPLQEAWLALLTQQAMGQPTYVLSDPFRGDAFVQVRYRAHQAAADIVYLAPSLGPGRQAAQAWATLLDGACVDVATRGIQRVFARLPESGPEIDVFHPAGFALYAGEDVYRLDRPPAQAAKGQGPSPRPQRLEDWPALQKLCVAITPQRVRQAEGGISTSWDSDPSCRRYVLPCPGGDDLLAALYLCTRGSAIWMSAQVHPDGHDAVRGLVHWGLAQLVGLPPRPVYCAVRKYQDGVRTPLEEAGFELCAARVLMVKHTAAWVKVPTQELAPALRSGVEPVPPSYHINGDPEYSAANGRLAAEHKR